MYKKALTVPVRVHFPGDRLGPALDGPLASVVVGVPCETELASKRRDVEDDTAVVVLILPHDLDGARCHTSCTEEESLDLFVSFFLRGRLCIPGEGVSSVVDDDIKTKALPKVL